MDAPRQPRRSRRRRDRVVLWTVVIEDPRTDGLDRVLLYAAPQPEDAETLARRAYEVLGHPPQNYRFWPQPISEVSGPDDAIYRIVLRRQSGPRR